MKPTQEQIIAWARESLEECDGTDYYDYTDKLHWWGKADEIVKFASIVAAAEREAIEKAAQMALDVLEHGLPIIEDYGGKQHIQLQHKAIAALYESLNAALAQPKPEPVAFYVYKPTLPRGNLGNVADGDLPWIYDQDPSSGYSARMLVYTAPLQREWQGLTDEEQNQVAWSCGAMSADWLDFARAIEAKLREKNFDRPS